MAWKLGRALEKIARAQGARSDKATSSTKLTTFRDFLKALGIDRQTALEMQRIGALPDDERRRHGYACTRSPWGNSPRAPPGRRALDKVARAVLAAVHRAAVRQVDRAKVFRFRVVFQRGVCAHYPPPGEMRAFGRRTATAGSSQQGWRWGSPGQPRYLLHRMTVGAS
jgi:hypothetical protein